MTHATTKTNATTKQKYISLYYQPTNYIRIHKKVVHGTNADPSKIVRCATCKFETLKQVNLRIHMNHKHRASHEKRKALDIAPTKCKFCVFVSSKRALVDHMKSTHPQEALFECDACSYKSNYQPNLNTHINAKHTKESFQCDKCYFKTMWKISFMDHMKVKQGIFQKNSKYKKDLEFSEIMRTKAVLVAIIYINKRNKKIQKFSILLSIHIK